MSKKEKAEKEPKNANKDKKLNKADKAAENKKLTKAEKKAAKKDKKSNKKRRKFHPFLRILSIITTLVLTVLIVVFGSIFTAYELIARPITNMSLPELVRTIGQVYNVNPDSIVTNPYAEDDAQKLVDGLTETLMLKTNLLIDDIVDCIAASIPADGVESNHDEVVVTAGNAFIELLQDAKFDFKGLEDYQGEEHRFVVTDRMVAGLVHEVLVQASKIPELEKLKQTIMVDNLVDVIDIDQMIVNGGERLEDTTFTLTLHAQVLPIVNALLSDSELDPTIKNLIPKVVPKELYLTGTISPFMDKAPVLAVNNMTKETMTKIFAMVDRIMDIAGQDFSINQMFSDVGNELYTVINRFQDIIQKVGLQFGKEDTPTPSGNINVDMFQAVLSVMEITDVTTQDLLYTLKTLHAIDNAGIVNTADYMDRNNLEVATVDAFNSDIQNLLSCYGVQTEDPTKYSIDNFFSNVDQIVNDINLVDHNTILGKPIYDVTNAELVQKSRISQLALTALIQKQIQDGLASGAPGQYLPVNILGIDIHYDPATDISTITITECMDLRSYVLAQPDIGTSPLASLISSLFPNGLYADISFPMVLDRDPNINYSKIRFNPTKDEIVTQADSDRMLDTLIKVMAALSPDSDFSSESLCKMIDSYVYQALDTLAANLDALHITTLSFGDGYIQMPTLYELIAGQSAPGTTAVGVQEGLQGFYSIDPVFSTGNIPTQPVENGIIINKQNQSVTITQEYLAEQVVNGLNAGGSTEYRVHKFDLVAGKSYYASYRHQVLQNTADSVSLVFAIDRPTGTGDPNTDMIISHFLPKTIYATIVLSKTDILNPIMTINNLSDKEVTRLLAALSPDGQPNYITDAIKDALNQVKAVQITMRLGDKLSANISLGELFNIMAKDATFAKGSITVELSKLINMPPIPEIPNLPDIAA